MIPAATFDAWCRCIDRDLLLYVGRTLADLPAACETWPRIWYKYGVPAWVVASGLSAFNWPPRATLTRFFGDTQAQQVRAQLAGSAAFTGVMTGARRVFGAPPEYERVMADQLEVFA